MDVAISVRLPVLSRATVSGLLAVPKTWLGKASDEGLAAAALRPVPALHNGVCQIPRPYVAATRTGVGDVLEVVLRATTGAPGNPEPNTDQQLETDCAQFWTWVVK
jgi:hypothetical protein